MFSPLDALWIIPIAWLVMVGNDARFTGGDSEARTSGNISVRDLQTPERNQSNVTMCCSCKDTVDMGCTNDPNCRGIRPTATSWVDHQSPVAANSTPCYFPAICSTTVYKHGQQTLFNKQCLPRVECLSQWVNSSWTTGCAIQDYSQIPEGRYCTYCCDNENPTNVDKCLYTFLSFIGQENYSFPPVTVSPTIPTTTSQPVTSTTSGSIHTTPHHSSHHPSTAGSTKATECEQCDGDSCSQPHSSVVKCSQYESFCLNVLHVDERGNFSITKKGCSSRYECLYDHSPLHATSCNYQGTSGSPGFAPGQERLCQFCCDGSGSSGPCNTDPVPQNTVDFEATSSTPTAGHVTQATMQSTQPSTHNVITTPVSTVHVPTRTPSTTTTLGQTSSGTSSSAAASSEPSSPSTLPTTTASPSTSKQTDIVTNVAKATTQTSVLNSTSALTSSSTTSTSSSTMMTSSTTSSTSPTTTTVTTNKTTAAPAPGHYTIPPVPTQCAVCMGPPEICEQLTQIVSCAPPDNYCINTIHNRADGTRSVNRACGNINTCYRDWYVGTSDSDKCQDFSGQRAYTVEFDCTFCCVSNKCNLPLKPDDNTLYQDKRN